MRERRFAALSLLALIAVVAFMSWRDLHPAAEAPDGNVASGYYAAENATPVSIPDDNLPVTILQGSFSGATYKPAGIEPFTLAQRQVNIAFRLDAAALRAPAPVLAQMEKTLHDWDKKGSSVAALLLDAPATDLDAYVTFIGELRRHFEKDQRTVIPVLPASGWPDSPGLRALAKTAPLFAYKLDSAALPVEFMDRMTREDHPFLLILPAGAEKSGIDGRSLRKGQLYRGGYVTIDPATPPVLFKEHRIGLWPQF